MYISVVLSHSDRDCGDTGLARAIDSDNCRHVLLGFRCGLEHAPGTNFSVTISSNIYAIWKYIGTLYCFRIDVPKP